MLRASTSPELCSWTWSPRLCRLASAEKAGLPSPGATVPAMRWCSNPVPVRVHHSQEPCKSQAWLSIWAFRRAARLLEALNVRMFYVSYAHVGSSGVPSNPRNVQRSLHAQQTVAGVNTRHVTKHYTETLYTVYGRPVLHLCVHWLTVRSSALENSVSLST